MLHLVYLASYSYNIDIVNWMHTNEVEEKIFIEMFSDDVVPSRIYFMNDEQALLFKLSDISDIKCTEISDESHSVITQSIDIIENIFNNYRYKHKIYDEYNKLLQNLFNIKHEYGYHDNNHNINCDIDNMIYKLESITCDYNATSMLFESLLTTIFSYNIDK